MKLDFFGKVTLAFVAGAILAAMVHRPAGAAEGDMRYVQMGIGSTQIGRLIPFPGTGAHCVHYLNGTTALPGCLLLGAGFTQDGTTLDVTAAPGPPGPTGATGATGATGPAGPAGTTDYTQLINVPATFPPSAHTHPASQISDSTATGRALMTATDAATARAAIGAGTVTSITAGAGLSGGTITGSGTISMPNVGTAGTYSGVTTDTQGRVTAGTTRSFAYTTRALNTCYQISATRDARVSYVVDIATQSTLASGQAGTVYLRIYSNSACTTGTQELTRYSSSLTQALGLTVTLNMSGSGALTGIIPAGAWVQQVTENLTGSPSFTARPGQEVLL